MIVRFLAIVVTGLALIAPGAHVYELPRKIVLPMEQYFVVQGIYRGWWIVGLLLPAALVANLALAYVARGKRLAFSLALGAAALIALNLVIFVTWTQPVNSVTNNWLLQPENWQALRLQWEYSHAVNAGVTLLAFCLATLAALRAPA
ncbi:MAG TPA: hypothetical protein VJR30_04130 [Bradyrhizobium sp.]|nr:hypothetical protein [Bradyrhizobium sp.]